MALIGSVAFKYETFRTITNTYEHVIGKTNLTKEKRYVHQNHKMLRSWDSRYYKYCVGGKTGFTDCYHFPTESKFTEPTNLGDKTGTISYTYEGQPMSIVEVSITGKYYNQIHGIEEKKETVKKTDIDKKTGMPTILKVILTIAIILIVAMLFLVCLVSYRRKQLEKMRRERRRRRREEWERMNR